MRRLSLELLRLAYIHQLKELRKIFQQKFKDRNSKIDELYSDGPHTEIGEDLLLFKETGNYLSDGEQEITLNQVISIIDEYLKKFVYCENRVGICSKHRRWFSTKFKVSAKTSKSYVPPYNWSHWGHSHK